MSHEFLAVAEFPAGTRQWTISDGSSASSTLAGASFTSAETATGDTSTASMVAMTTKRLARRRAQARPLAKPGAKVKTSKRTSRWRARRRQTKRTTRRREVALASIVSAAELSAVAVTVSRHARRIAMDSIWMGIAPGSLTTRVVAMAGPGETILKAQLATGPSTPALATLLEAIALWQGQPVRGALCRRVGTFVRLNLCREAFWTTAALSTASPGSTPARTAADGLASTASVAFAISERLVISEVAR
ncbi:MAG: hypothetical protein IPG04_43370 [Polyangiaceae bacterium]|nr:hypothetical protein [Polyangiaceae bacterium]